MKPVSVVRDTATLVSVYVGSTSISVSIKEGGLNLIP
jgi:hypothetical protein